MTRPVLLCNRQNCGPWQGAANGPLPAFAGVLRALAGAAASTTNPLTLEMVGTPTLPRGKTPTDGPWQDDRRYSGYRHPCTETAGSQMAAPFTECRCAALCRGNQMACLAED